MGKKLKSSCWDQKLISFDMLKMGSEKVTQEYLRGLEGRQMLFKSNTFLQGLALISSYKDNNF